MKDQETRIKSNLAEYIKRHEAKGLTASKRFNIWMAEFNENSDLYFIGDLQSGEMDFEMVTADAPCRILEQFQDIKEPVPTLNQVRAGEYADELKDFHIYRCNQPFEIIVPEYENSLQEEEHSDDVYFFCNVIEWAGKTLDFKQEDFMIFCDDDCAEWQENDKEGGAAL